MKKFRAFFDYLYNHIKTIDHEDYEGIEKYSLHKDTIYWEDVYGKSAEQATKVALALAELAKESPHSS